MDGNVGRKERRPATDSQDKKGRKSSICVTGGKDGQKTHERIRDDLWQDGQT
jgi:hypothetical protein